MDIHQRITGLKSIDLSWVPWLLAGWSMGGLLVVAQRALWLIGSSSWFGELRAKIGHLSRRAASTP